MKINEIDVLVTKIDLKQNKEGKPYIVVDFLDLESGDTFNIIEKDIEVMKSLKQMTKYKISLVLNSNKYGLKLGLKEVVEELGGIY
ncbi:hypothetical protein [Clostridium ihumii]|uniref:hypothetical protein n=1 Tax=Clostridium ihumii TaxID=1470356 RepID=UPI000558AE50|nr:hypothetical protein [Clostridium ihumii]